VTYLPGIGVDTSVYDPHAVGDGDVARVRTELGLAASQRLLLVVAELNPGKRHRDAVAALAAADRPHVVLALAGEGPEASAILDQARALGVADRVKLLGYRRDVPTLLRAAFALALPSEREGLPRCIMEASCLERPVIATRIRGVTELVTDGLNGILHDVGDVSALAAAIRLLVDDPDRAAAMGLAGPDAMRPFDLTTVLTGHDDVYRKVLGPRFA
jgi:glycosyltransferase involved in cell wall biosynthesis